MDFLPKLLFFLIIAEIKRLLFYSFLLNSYEDTILIEIIPTRASSRLDEVFCSYGSHLIPEHKLLGQEEKFEQRLLVTIRHVKNKEDDSDCWYQCTPPLVVNSIRPAVLLFNLTDRYILILRTPVESMTSSWLHVHELRSSVSSCSFV
jgi:hypothetical protein